LEKFLDKIKQNVKSLMEFPMTKDFREEFEINYQSMNFDSHIELDSFVKKLIDKDTEFEENHKHDWQLLKSFDRAFWLRYYKITHSKNYKVEENKEEKWKPDHKCPFGDPEETRSFMKYLQ